WCHLRAAAPRELLLDPAVPGIGDALDRLPVEEVYGAMGDGEVAARGYGVEQAGHDRVRVVGVRDRVQDREHRDRHWLGEVKQFAGPVKDRAGVPEVRLDVL